MERDAYKQMADQEKTHWWYCARRHILETVLAGLHLPQKASLLEVGSGTGGNIEFLSNFGSVDGVEPCLEARNFALSNYGVTLKEGTLPDGLDTCQPNSYDAVLALDVIEHVQQDREALQALALRLKTGGFMIMTVPAYRWMWSSHDEFHHHKRRYTKADILALISQIEGLSCVRATYFNTLLFPFALFVRLLKQALGLKFDEVSASSGPMNNVFKTIFSFEASLLKFVDFPMGLSLLVIAKRTR